MQKERAHLDKASLLSTVKREFAKIPDPKRTESKYSISNCMMNVCAIFGLKYPSLLRYNDEVSEPIIEHNIKSLYQVTAIPSDTHLRARLDDIDPKPLQNALDALITPLQRGKILTNYLFLGEYYLVSLDGTGYFSSDSVHCVNCCVKHSKAKCDFEIRFSKNHSNYVHQLISWKSECLGKAKDRILLLYSPAEDSYKSAGVWELHVYDADNAEYGSPQIPGEIKSEVLALLAKINSAKVTTEIKNQIEILFIENQTLFDGKDISGKKSYYHQLLSTVLVHPDHKQVFPLAIEPISKQDGASKNDCERNAAIRLLRTLKTSHPHLRLVIVLDALYANGPLIKLLTELNFRYIITAKNTEYLYDAHLVNPDKKIYTTESSQLIETYTYSAQLPLNITHKELKVNLLEYKSVASKKNGDKLRYYSSWLTDLPLAKNNLQRIMRGARARWKIENEVHNTLKNQGYNFEHNYGHGNNNLSTVFAYGMFITFLIDQIQDATGYYFKQIKDYWKRISYVWDKIRIQFFSVELDNWEQLFLNIIKRFKPEKMVNTT